jgi:hypothetical protein
VVQSVALGAPLRHVCWQARWQLLNGGAGVPSPALFSRAQVHHPSLIPTDIIFSATDEILTSSS